LIDTNFNIKSLQVGDNATYETPVKCQKFKYPAYIAEAQIAGMMTPLEGRIYTDRDCDDHQSWHFSPFLFFKRTLADMIETRRNAAQADWVVKPAMPKQQTCVRIILRSSC